MNDEILRSHVVRLLTWADAHVIYDEAVVALPFELQGVKPPNLPYSAWQLLEHLRLTQLDILEFCRNPEYREPSWPHDYWPGAAAPPSDGAWHESVERFLADRAELVRMAEDPSIDLGAAIPHGDGQTYLREFLLVADHNAYHLGELIVVRRLLAAWPVH